MLSSAERRLTAIMFTDVVGYGAMTQRNEELALELLQLHREMLRPIFRSLGGNEIKTMGDAFLVEFQSALQAARCAIAIQREMRRYNGSVAEERKINVRIGLHIGDVVFESNDVYGDGVNLASRIYTQAQPGGIVITRSVYDQIYNKIDVTVRRMGPQRLKSIQKPVELFSIELDGKQAYHISPTSAAGLSTLGVIAVLIAAYFIWGGHIYDSPPITTPTDSLTIETPDTTASRQDTTETVSNVPDANGSPSQNTAENPTQGQAPTETTATSDPLYLFRAQYATVTTSANWYELQRALKRGNDMGALSFYTTRDSLPSLEGVLVAVLDPSASGSSPIDAYLVFTDSRYVNLKTSEEISTLSQRYSGKRVIWVRALQ